jgi:hypothetical protein
VVHLYHLGGTSGPPRWDDQKYGIKIRNIFDATINLLRRNCYLFITTKQRGGNKGAPAWRKKERGRESFVKKNYFREERAFL